MRKPPKSPADTSVDTISKLATSVYDTGRRGLPRLGCDCVQCFGYCIIDRDQFQRDASEQSALKGVIIAGDDSSSAPARVVA